MSTGLANKYTEYAGERFSGTNGIQAPEIEAAIQDDEVEDAHSITVSVTRTNGQTAKQLANRQAASILTGVNRAQAASCRSIPLNREGLMYGIVPAPEPILGCERLNKVKTEATRRQTFTAHLPIKKRGNGKSPRPMQEINPWIVTPGYMLARNNTKLAMYIKAEEFFNDTAQSNKVSKEEQECREIIENLKSQVYDLTMYLEEERKSHRESKRKAIDNLRNKVEQIVNQNIQNMSCIREDYETEIQIIKDEHKTNIEDLNETAEIDLNKLRGECESLHGAFESYKAQLRQEMETNLGQDTIDLKRAHLNELNESVSHAQIKLRSDFTHEKADMKRKSIQERELIIKEHKQQLNKLKDDFENKSDLMRLQDEFKEKEDQLLAKSKAKDTEIEKLKDKLRKCNIQLDNSKVDYQILSKSMDERANQIADKFRQELDDLKLQNSELRQLYVSKCEQLFTETMISTETCADRARTATDTMTTLIHTRMKAGISIATPADDYITPPTVFRPVSAPQTRRESRKARFISGNIADRYAEEKAKRAAAQNSLIKQPVFDSQTSRE